ncbi:MAG TPA: spore coat protein U domain-containing protein [Alphaproteobacteria bacterium]|nr:spore coat protein U domain-containing protein [Alphaproteobacteria bacterium]
MTKFPRLALSAALIAAALPGAALANNASGQVKLKGTVALTCTVAVQDMNESLDLVNGEANQSVGTVVETCNSGSGYTISLSSSNGGALVSDTGTAPVAYSVSYDGQGGSLGSALSVSRNGAQFGRQATLAVNVQGNAQALAGNYSDTVTITIAAK